MNDCPQYIAELRRWGDNETHHYIVAVTPCPALAACQAWLRAMDRGGKYAGVVLKIGTWNADAEEVWRHESMCG